MSKKIDKQTAKAEETLLKRIRRFISKRPASVSTTENDKKAVNEDEDYGEAMRERLNERRDIYHGKR